MKNDGIHETKRKLKKSQKLTKLGQIIYITCANFMNNNLWESASSCSFGFIFSFIPLSLIIIALLTGLIKLSPDIYQWVLKIVDEIRPVYDITPFLSNLMNNNAIHWVDILLGFWVIWMARKMFLSIMQAMTKIFRSVSERKTIINQLFIFILEFLIVILIAFTIISAFIFNQILDHSFLLENFSDIIPFFITRNSHNLLSVGMYIIIFISSSCIFKLSSGTHPKLSWCIIYAALSTFCFYVFSLFISKFMDLTNYNVIYGTVSTLVILMMKVYFFFVIFLFFAQMIYVTQYFDILLKSQIYLLPTEEEEGLINNLRRIMFLNPSALKTSDNTLYFKAGDLIYAKGEASNCVYYLRSGKITEECNDSIISYTAGSFFGDTQCLLNQPRTGNAIADTEVKLIVFSAEEFKELIRRSPVAATKAVAKISEDSITQA
ncbi:MAG: YihY/virulence factor BrkB family protein [Treponema sp.]|nr:YihY/virulence factor BrkB family protein [Treponema sp.]